MNRSKYCTLLYSVVLLLALFPTFLLGDNNGNGSNRKKQNYVNRNINSIQGLQNDQGVSRANHVNGFINSIQGLQNNIKQNLSAVEGPEQEGYGKPHESIATNNVKGSINSIQGLQNNVREKSKDTHGHQTEDHGEPDENIGGNNVKGSINAIQGLQNSVHKASEATEPPQIISRVPAEAPYTKISSEELQQNEPGNELSEEYVSQHTSNEHPPEETPSSEVESDEGGSIHSSDTDPMFKLIREFNEIEHRPLKKKH